MVNFRNCPKCGTVVVPDRLQNVVEAFKCPKCEATTILNICNGECEACKTLDHCGECSLCVHDRMKRNYEANYPV